MNEEKKERMRRKGAQKGGKGPPAAEIRILIRGQGMGGGGG